VRSAYESTMLAKFAVDIVAGVNEQVGPGKVEGTLNGGFEAAQSVIQLVRTIRKIVPPERINDVSDDVEGRDRVDHLFEELGTSRCAAWPRAPRKLARLWDSAWRQGGGDSIGALNLIAMPKAKLRQRYERKTLESLTLREMAVRGIGIP
jgi:hypothetical protein